MPHNLPVQTSPYPAVLTVIGVVALLYPLTSAAVVHVPGHRAFTRQQPQSIASRAMSTAAASITPVRQDELHLSTPTWWLKSRFHFSFADWYDPSRSAFGVLRVVNDDLVEPRAGFGTHPHRDMEIFSYVVDGELSHADSMGNKEALPRGCVQYMSAGTGVLHSEMNDGAETCRFLQIWIVPDRRGHTPQYGSSRYTKEDRHNRLLHILGGSHTPPAWPGVNTINCIKLHQDANVYVSESDPGHSISVELGQNRQAYMVCIEGSLTVNDTYLSMRDAAKIVGSASGGVPLTLTAGDKGAHYLLVEMPRA